MRRAWRSAALVALALALAPGVPHAAAQVPNVAALTEARQQLAAATDPGARRTALARVLEERRRLIRAHGDDPGAVFWMLDQAADLVFELLPLGGTDLALFTGMPTIAQLAVAERVAEQVPALLDSADRLLGPAIEALESSPEYAGDEAMQARRRRLAIEERDYRMPLMRGIAAAVAAECRAARGFSGAAAAREAEARLAPLEARLGGALRPLARWVRAAAMLRLERLDEAIAHAQAAEGDEAALPADRFASRLLRVRAVTVQDGIPAGLELLDAVERNYLDSAGLFYRLLIADRRCALRLQLAADEPQARRAAAVRHAIDAYLELEDVMGLDAETSRMLVLERLRTAPLEGVPLEALPPIVTIARAEALARDPGTRAEAMALLQAALARPGLDAASRMALVFEHAEALQLDGRTLEAALAYEEVAAAGAAQAEEAIERAARLAAADGSDPVLTRRILDLFLAEFPHLPGAERWRYERARLDLAVSDFDAARAGFDAIPDTAPLGVDARFMSALAESRRLDALERDPGRGDPSYAERREALDATRAARAAATGALATGRGPKRAADLAYYAAMASILEAEVQLGLDEPEAALEALDSLAEGALAAEALDEEAVLVRSTRVRVSALRELGDAEAIDTALQTVTDRTGARAGAILEAVLLESIDEIERLGREEREPGRRAVLEAGIGALARRLDLWLEGHPDALPAADMDRLRRRCADGYRLGAAHGDALRHYDVLVQAHPDAAEILFGRAEALFGAGGDGLGEAMQLYRRLARGTVPGDGLYWPVQLRLLQILDRVGRNTDQIVPRIERLRMQDARLGGSPWQRQFGVLETKYR